MSLTFSDTTTKKGIIQHIESNCGFDDGGITSNTTRLKKFTSEVNLALDEVFATIFEAGGVWQFDDSNHGDFPEIKTDLVSGQRDYTFTTDEQGNLVLDIYKVYVADSSGIYHEAYQVDVEATPSMGTQAFTDGINTGGTPYRYNLTANGIELDPRVDYNYTNGLKVKVNREGSYFAYTDTTKKAGFNGLFHEYLALKPSYNYARNKGLSNKNDLKVDLFRMRDEIIASYSNRSRNVINSLKATSIESR